MQGLGLLAFNGAVLAANIAAKDLLEKLWWMSMIAIAVSIVFCIGVLGAGKFDVGKTVARAKQEYGPLSEPEINAALVDDLIEALSRANGVLAGKARAVGLAIIALLVAGGLAAISALRS